MNVYKTVAMIRQIRSMQSGKVNPPGYVPTVMDTRLLRAVIYLKSRYHRITGSYLDNKTLYVKALYKKSKEI